MASIVVRGLDDDVKAQLAERARARGRSMESEVRDILTMSVDQKRASLGIALLEAAQGVGGFEHLPVPERTGRAGAVHFE